MKKMNENEIATAMKVGVVDGGEENMFFDVSPGSTDVSNAR
jgi:TRAP-type C4-dicarboxylate transport system substrate-binding protein